MFDEYVYKLNYLFSVEPSIILRGPMSSGVVKYLIFYIKDTFDSIDDSFNFGHVEVAKILQKLYDFDIIEPNEFYQIEEDYDINDFNNCYESEYAEYKRHMAFNKELFHKEELNKEVWRLIQREDITSYADVYDISVKKDDFKKITTYISDGNCTICNLDKETIKKIHDMVIGSTMFHFDPGYNLIIRDINNMLFSMQDGLLEIGLFSDSPNIKPILIKVKSCMGE
jgi:hypothetical protein